MLDYWKLPNGTYFVKMKKDEGLDDDIDIKNILPSHLGACILSNSKRISNSFVRQFNGFYKNNIYYTDMDSLYIGKKIGMFDKKLVWLALLLAEVKTIIDLEVFLTDFP